MCVLFKSSIKFKHVEHRKYILTTLSLATNFKWNYYYYYVVNFCIFLFMCFFKAGPLSLTSSGSSEWPVWPLRPSVPEESKFSSQHVLHGQIQVHFQHQTDFILLILKQTIQHHHICHQIFLYKATTLAVVTLNL